MKNYLEPKQLFKLILAACLSGCSGTQSGVEAKTDTVANMGSPIESDCIANSKECYYWILTPPVEMFDWGPSGPSAKPKMIIDRRVRTRGELSADGQWVFTRDDNTAFRRRDLVASSEFQRISGCWPVKGISYAAGDNIVSMGMEVDGAVSIGDLADLELTGHVYYHALNSTSGIGDVRVENREYPTFDSVWIDLEARTAFVYSPEYTERYEWRADEELEGCREIPRTK